MSGASDKARFYLEQSVPELREWERREIFTKEEIRAIAAKRSDFEHILNARGSQPSDYARYAEYEMNVEALRRKRVKRKGAKTTAHTGQRRIFFILDRATKKFHGDVGLWMQYIEYARKQKANKKLSKILTDVLRMHPTKAELWIYAARYSMDVQADIGTARSYMQRGLRFCQNSKTLYLEYARLEMSYIAKIAARRKILGIGEQQDTASATVGARKGSEDLSADIIVLPTFTAGEAQLEPSGTSQLQDTTMVDLAKTPAMTGAIPLAIFDAAMDQFKNDELLGESFFDVFADFIGVPCARQLLQAVFDRLYSSTMASVVGVSCSCRLRVVGIPKDSPEFPLALGEMLRYLRSALGEMQASLKPALSGKILSWLSPMAESELLGPELKLVLSATQKQLLRNIPR